MKPSLCRSVLYSCAAGVFAAVVTGVNEDETVDLTVFPPGGAHPYGVTSVSEATPESTGWSWPPREDGGTAVTTAGKKKSATPQE